MHDTKCPRLRHSSQLHIFIVESRAESLLRLAHSPDGKRRSSPDQRSQHQGAGSTRARLGAKVEQLLGVVLLQMLQGERRARAVAQQPFPARPDGTVDSH